MQPTRLPPPIRRTKGRGFADFTIVRRLPGILADALRAVGRDGSDGLMRDVEEGRRIDTSALARPTPFWGRYLDGLAGAAWSDLPFFDLEFLFYHAINSTLGFFDSGVDVFARIRERALAEAIDDFDRDLANVAGESPAAHLRDLLLRATYGNEADYSYTEIFAGRARDRSVFLVDESEALAQIVSASRPARVDVIADNAGRELTWDLALIDAVLASGAGRVVLHMKPWPMFVSDALIDDARRTLAVLGARPPGSPARRAADRLSAALAGGHLAIEADASWGEPRHFSNLDGPLAAALAEATVVIAKGDLNYRRLVDDRAWPADTPAAEASAGIPFSAFALRVLKSEAVAGIPSSVASDLDARVPEWRTNGGYAVVQRLGRAPG